MFSLLTFPIARIDLRLFFKYFWGYCWMNADIVEADHLCIPSIMAKSDFSQFKINKKPF